MTACSKCGYNPDKLTEYMKTVIPKERIEQRIKQWESYEDDMCFECMTNLKHSVLEELKGLLEK